MKITKVNVTRKFNLGNYESIDIGMEAEVTPEENPNETMQILRDNIEMEYINQKTAKRPNQPLKPAAPATQKSVMPSDPISKMQSHFTVDLLDRLTFTEKGKDVVIKPVAFLGSEIFAEVSRVVRGMGGEYVSAGKDSHWRVPI